MIGLSPDRLDPDRLRASLPSDATVGRQILVFEETDSTNDLAARAGGDGLPEGLVIFAESQRAGRGRLGRRWLAPPYQSLLFSILLRPPTVVPPSRWPELTFCAALAVAEAVESETGGQPARIKWPNDVLIAGRKIAGILLETHHRQSPGFVVIGIGLNVLQRVTDLDPTVRERAGSLAMLAPPASPPPDRHRTAASILSRFEAHYRHWPSDFPAIMAACEHRGCHEPTPEPSQEKGGSLSETAS